MAGGAWIRSGDDRAAECEVPGAVLVRFRLRPGLESLWAYITSILSRP